MPGEGMGAKIASELAGNPFSGKTTGSIIAAERTEGPRFDKTLTPEQMPQFLPLAKEAPPMKIVMKHGSGA